MSAGPTPGEAYDSQLRRMLDYSLDAAYVHVDDVLVYANDAAARLAGAATPADIIGRHASAFVGDADRARLPEIRQQILSDGRTDAVFEFGFLRLDGRSVDVESTGVEIEWEGRRAIQVFARDVSKRSEAELHLRKSAADLRGVLESFPEAVYVHADDELLYVNPTLVQLFGQEAPADLIGRSALSLYLPESQGKLRAVRAAMLEGRGPTKGVDGQCLRRDGSTFSAIATGRAVEWEGRPAIVVSLHDITDRLRVEKQLRDSADRFRMLFELSPDAVFVHVSDRIVFANPAAARHFGFAHQDDMTGHSALALFAPEHHARIIAHRRATPDSSRTTWEVFRFMRVNGTEFQGDTVGGPLTWDDAQARLVVVRDLTDRLRTEEQLYHAQKMDALGKMTAGIAHEFNNVLTVISGFAQMAGRDPSNTARISDCLDEVSKATKVAASLTQRMLAFGRKNETRPEVMSVGELLNDLRSMLTPMLGEQVRLSIDTQTDGALARIDRHQFSQAIINMAINAAHAMPDGGGLTLSSDIVGVDEDAAKLLPDIPAGRYVLASIADTGTGIEESSLRRIFEPFFTTKRSGSGLGLAVVYGMVRTAGGAIDVHSHLGEGTRFDIYLPLAEAEDAPSPQATAVAEGARAAGTILVVEDKPPVLALAQMALEDAGFAVLTAPDGHAAVALFADRGTDIDLVLTDIAMPGMNGPALANRLRERRPDLKVVMMSGHAAFDSAGTLTLDEQTSFIQKPFDPDDLCEQIGAMLGRVT